jgi:hypothetical protein
MSFCWMFAIGDYPAYEVGTFRGHSWWDGHIGIRDWHERPPKGWGWMVSDRLSGVTNAAQVIIRFMPHIDSAWGSNRLRRPSIFFSARYQPKLTHQDHDG